MRLVVTGSSGFLGKALCRKLLEAGHEILGLSRTGGADGIRYPPSMIQLPYMMGDRLPTDVIAFGPEALVHLAWDGIPDFTEEKCLENVETQIRFLRETKKLTKLKKIVVAGTCLEYGAKHGVKKETERLPPDSYLSWAKQTLSEYFALSCKEREVALVWFRIFYVYGPGQRAESLIPSLISALRSNQEPSIKNPSATNDYIYIDDVVSAFAKAVDVETCTGTFNLGTGRLTSVAEIVGLVERSIQSSDKFSSRLVENKCEPTSVSSMWADISLLERQIGWMPKVNLAEGIELSCKATSDKKV